MVNVPTNVSVRIARISFGVLPSKKKYLVIALVSMFLKSADRCSEVYRTVEISSFVNRFSTFLKLQ